MARKWLLGIDLGGGGVRCLLVDVGTGETTVASQSWRFPRASDPLGLGFDLDLEAIWRLSAQACRESLVRADAAADEVVGIGVSALRFGSVILDQRGEARFAVPNRDARAAVECFQLAASDGEAVLGETGLWPMPIHASVRLLWLKNHCPEVLEPNHRLLSLSDWLNFRLCGVMATDFSQAGCTGLFELEAKQWNWQRIAGMGLPGEMFPEVRPSGELLGGLSEEAARDFGLKPKTAVALAGADTQCGLLGAGAIRPGDVAAIAGTTAPVQAVSDRAEIDTGGRLWSGHHTAPGRFVLESNGGPMGETLSWISRLLRPDDSAPEEALFADAARADVGAAGMLSTLGAEVMNARAPTMPAGQITMTHMTSAHDERPGRHLARAIVEGYACAVRANLEQLIDVMSLEVSRLDLSGGVSRSNLFAQILANVVGVEVRPTREPEATALGAAICSAIAAGVFDDIPAAVDSLTRARESHWPEPTVADANRELYESWCRLRDAGADTTAPAVAGHVTPWALRVRD
ncbi:MAG: FGGY-family carbohydrate kinase [Deltaproteobacteria bacterium]|nr:FGGY-family carbohydrate kinase [Deltaproteobacteria bacterium]MBW2724269.1 FGGY-family carbohydrate kinase [Deltaproteobacteria bacterium]